MASALECTVPGRNFERGAGLPVETARLSGFARLREAAGAAETSLTEASFSKSLVVWAQNASSPEG